MSTRSNRLLRVALKQQKGRKKHKYGAKRTQVDGIRFDSKAEARRWSELRLLEQAGEIESLERQPEFALHAASTSGQLVRAAHTAAGIPLVVGKFRADFKYYDARRGWIVEEVKGFFTPLARWKVKHAELQYGIQIQVIR